MALFGEYSGHVLHVRVMNSALKVQLKTIKFCSQNLLFRKKTYECQGAVNFVTANPSVSRYLSLLFFIIKELDFDNLITVSCHCKFNKILICSSASSIVGLYNKMIKTR